MGDLNARIGNAITDGIKQKFNESHNNSNGDTLVEFCAQNENKQHTSTTNRSTK